MDHAYYPLPRRQVLKGAIAAGVGVLVVSQPACDKPDVDFYVNTVTTSLAKLKPLLPAQAALLSKAISIAKEINDAYQDGKFDSAKALADNLLTVIDDIVAAAGVNLSDKAKVALAMIDIALTTIALLIKGATPTATSMASRAADPGGDRIEALASPKRINAIFEAGRP